MNVKLIICNSLARPESNIVDIIKLGFYVHGVIKYLGRKTTSGVKENYLR